jgi:hypothetical protein
VVALRAIRLYRMPPITPPTVAWNPHEATLDYRGRTFHAEQLGSFDGRSWLWSWANPFLDLPAEKTTIARRLRDSADELGIPALAEPHIACTDERLPHRFGTLAVGHGLAESYYHANQQQVLVVLHGQLDDVAIDPFDELAAALTEQEIDVTYLRPALEQAAAEYGLTVATPDDDWVVIRNGEGAVMRVFRDGTLVRPYLLARCFLARRHRMEDVVERLRGIAALSDTGATAALTGEGFSIRLTRTDRLRAVVAEQNALALEEDRQRVRGFGAVIRVEVEVTPEYRGVVYRLVSALGLPFGRGYAPAETTRFGLGLDPVSQTPAVPAEALAVCETLNKLDEALVYDEVNRGWYPRA